LKRLSSKEAFRLLPLALILGVSLFSTGFWIVDPLLYPDAGDYQQVQKVVRGQWTQGDVLVVQPWWAARAREYLGDLAFLQVRRIADEDFSRYRRVWVITLPGHRDLEGPFDDGTYLPELEQQIGGLELWRFRLPDSAREVAFDFRAQLHTALLRYYAGGQGQPCNKWNQDRWHCSPRDWEYVGRVVVDLGTDPREVIWAHPLLTGALEISFDRVPGGKSLRVHTGLTPDAARAPEDTPVTLTVFVNGRELGRVVQQDQTGYFPHHWDISHLGPGPHNVTFRVTCPRPHLRIFCFDGEIHR
jgi:hypothetical protein